MAQPNSPNQTSLRNPLAALVNVFQRLGDQSVGKEKAGYELVAKKARQKASLEPPPQAPKSR